MKTNLCIPGNWADRSEIVTSIAKSNMGNYIFAGNILLNLKTTIGYEVELFDRDELLKESFRWAGLVNNVSEEFLEEIDKHSFVIYLSGECGSLQSAKEIAMAGMSILNSGGTGIKVETTGKAFTSKQWEYWLYNFEEPNLYQMFVLDSIENGDSIFSCGMHNLGYKDTIVSGEEVQYSIDLISIFGNYQIIDQPTIKSHQTFSSSENDFLFEIIDEQEQPYKGHKLYGNPFGMWRLKRKNP